MKNDTLKIRYWHLLVLALVLLLIIISTFSFNGAANENEELAGNEEALIGSFVEEAIVKSLTVTQSAENALKSTTSQSVSAYAQKMINEYRKIYSNLLALADRKEIDTTKRSVVEKTAEEIAVQKTDDNSFDVAYARNQIAVHQHTISLFQHAATSDDYDTRLLATSTLPYLMQHLQMAEQLFAATAETKTDIHQDRDNQVDYSEEDQIPRTPSTERYGP